MDPSRERTDVPPLDVATPILDRFTTCSALRGESELNRLGLAVSANHGADGATAARTDHHQPNPFLPPELLSGSRQLLPPSVPALPSPIRPARPPAPDVATREACRRPALSRRRRPSISPHTRSL